MTFFYLVDLLKVNGLTDMTSKQKTEVSSKTIFKRNPDQVFSEIDGEIVILSIKNGEYYNLSDVGSEIWRQIEKSCSFEELIQNLTEEYDIGNSNCTNDTKEFLIELLAKGLVISTDELSS